MKRRRRQTEEDLEYLEKRPKSVQRRKANPELRMADLLEKIINTTAAATEVGLMGQCMSLVVLLFHRVRHSENQYQPRSSQTIIMSSNSPWTCRL